MKIKLGSRIILGFSCMIVIILVMLGVLIYNFQIIKTELSKYTLNNQKIEIVKDIQQSMQILSKNNRGAIVFENDPAILAKQEEENTAARDVLYTGIDTLKKFSLTQEEAEKLKAYDDNSAPSKKYNELVVEFINSKKYEEAAEVLAKHAEPHMLIGFNSLNKLSDLAEAQRTKARKIMLETYNNSMKISIGLTLICIVFGVVLSLLITRSITKPINRIVDSLTEGSNQVAAASNQLSSSSQQLAEGSAEQSSSLQETSSTLEESASMVQQNTENTKQAAMLSEEVKAVADQGNLQMQEMTESMNEIKKSSDQISKIIKVIDDIAFQTNILALNAAVEAARAGEAGMGFAVVAEEVRNLAQRSAQAAKDTAGMIENNIELSEKGVNVTQMIRETLSEITIQAKKMSDLMAEVAASSQEQSQGISQINKALVQMETVVQQNAANAEESASASEELSAQARNLKGMIQQLVILVHGKVERKYESLFKEDRIIHQAKQSNSAYNSIEVGRQVPQLQTQVTHIQERTKMVSPEEIIPLNRDNEGF